MILDVKKGLLHGDLGIGNHWGKGPKVGTCLVHPRGQKEACVAGGEQSGDEWRESHGEPGHADMGEPGVGFPRWLS